MTNTNTTTTTTTFTIGTVEAKALKSALTAHRKADKKLKELILFVAQRAVRESATREAAGKALADCLGLAKLSDDKAVSNSWQYAAKQAGLQSRKKSGKATPASASDNASKPT